MPAICALDQWTEYSNESNTWVDVLLPNGIYLSLETNKDATLREIKEAAWKSAQSMPMFFLLKEPEAYAFVIVSSSTGEQDVQNEESRRLNEVKPFLAVLRLVERAESRKAEKALDARLRRLLGKGLIDPEAQTSSEVHDFRLRMKILCEESNPQSTSQTWHQRLLREYPVDLETTVELPPYLTQKLHDGHLVLSIHLEYEDSESTFKFSVLPNINSKELLEIVLNKKSHCPGLEKGNLDDFIFKICGLEEYVVGPYPLSQYKYIREAISCDKIPELILMSVNTVQLEDDDPEIACIERPRCSTQLDLLQQSKVPTSPGEELSTWDIDAPFAVRVHDIRCLNCENKSKVAVRLALYHGDELLCKEVCTSSQTLEEGECKWEEEISFDIAVCNMPRAVRLCIFVAEFGRTIKSNRTRRIPDNKQDMYVNPLCWVNTMVFDYRNILKGELISLCLWPYNDDIDADIMYNPLGGVVSNPEDQAPMIALSFGKYHHISLEYPSLHKILEYAESFQKEVIDPASNSAVPPQGSKSHLEQLRQISEKDFLYQLHEQEKELMWFLRRDCLHHLPQSALPKLLRCVKWSDKKEVAEMLFLLQAWPLLPPTKALELLDYAYADLSVRRFAVECLKELSDEDLSLYLLQLVRALKHEPYLYCELLEFLLKRALQHRYIGHKLFWLLKSEMAFPDVSLRFGLILEAYCRGATGHVPALTKQVEALRKLKSVSLHANDNFRRKENREKMKFLLQESLNKEYYQSVFLGLKNPLDPRLKLKKIRVEKCKILDSKMKPLWLVFENSDSYGKDVFVIFKNGDDLRQDMLTLQMIRIMDRMWKDEGLDFRMIPYHCLATDYKVGLIEVVTDADTIANIQKEKGFTPTSAFKKGSILSWLKDHNPDEKSLNKAAEEFTLSCAGYSVATYVLGVADRHSDNIMLKKNGQLFHIDFGHILGKFKEKFGIKRERVPFVLTHDFVYIITKGHTQKSEEFNRFQQYCEQAFTILRRKGPVIISLFAMMLSTGMPELSCEKDLDYLRETLVLDMTEQEALRHFRSKFDEALRNSWKTSVNWMAHNLAKDNKIADSK